MELTLIELDPTTFFFGIAICIAHRIVVFVLSTRAGGPLKKVSDFEVPHDWSHMEDLEAYSHADCLQHRWSRQSWFLGMFGLSLLMGSVALATLWGSCAFKDLGISRLWMPMEGVGGDVAALPMMLDYEGEAEEEPSLIPQVGNVASFVSMPLKRHHAPKNGTRYHTSSYYGTIYVGTPARPFTVVFDTGSGHIILPSSACQAPQCLVHGRYDRGASSTMVPIQVDGREVRAQEAHENITIGFGTGEIKGPFVKDNICAQDSAASSDGTNNDDATHEHVKGCVSMGFIDAAEMSEKPFGLFHFDGIVGLGLSGLSETPGFNFMGVMAQFGGGPPHGVIRETFAMFLGNEYDEEDSVLTLGGWDASHLMEDLTWNPVYWPWQGHWIVRIKALRVDGVPLSFCNEGCKAVLDSGTPLLSVPPPLFAQAYKALRHVPEDGRSCKGAGPRLDFELESSVVTLLPADYAEAQSVRSHAPSNASAEFSESSPADLGLNADETPTFCKPMLMALDIPAPLGPKLFILGEKVLQKYYVVYDGQDRRVGLALARHRQNRHLDVRAPS